MIRTCGIVGLGGAAFPTSIKLALSPEMKIDTLIINGTEGEPYLTNDEMLMSPRTPATW
jgi:electron transport complex protein RnfC